MNASAPRGDRDEAGAKALRDDLRLMSRIAGGDLRAFERFYKEFHPRLSRFLHVTLRRPQLVEEVLNDTMMVVWTRAGTYTGGSRLSTWIFTIAYRKAARALKGLDEPVDDAGVERTVSEEPDAETAMGRRESVSLLLGALDGLSAEHRSVVDLTYFQEFGYREIAQIMECPVDTVKTRMFHARRRLKDILGGGLADWL
jgi:RNA polymerase sigma-70 factor (ECF subfamily)